MSGMALDANAMTEVSLSGGSSGGRGYESDAIGHSAHLAHKSALQSLDATPNPPLDTPARLEPSRSRATGRREYRGGVVSGGAGRPKSCDMDQETGGMVKIVNFVSHVPFSHPPQPHPPRPRAEATNKDLDDSVGR